MDNATPVPQIMNPELWQFPMNYPIKLIGNAGDDLLHDVRAIILKHFPDFDIATIEVIPSSKGTYHSVRAVLPFDTKEQVVDIYKDFAASPHIKTAI